MIAMEMQPEKKKRLAPETCRLKETYHGKWLVHHTILELSMFSFKSDQQPSLRTSNCRIPCIFAGYEWNCMDMQVVNMCQLPDSGTGRRVKELSSVTSLPLYIMPISLSPSLKSLEHAIESY